MQNAGRMMGGGTQCKTIREGENSFLFPFFFFSNATSALNFFSCSFEPGASWNLTGVTVVSGTHFAWSQMLTVSSNSLNRLHDSQLGFVTLITLP